ncbi:hypothetical protein ACHQM5_027820 [Ranunculus cassubicifolius]
MAATTFTAIKLLTPNFPNTKNNSSLALSKTSFLASTKTLNRYKNGLLRLQQRKSSIVASAQSNFLKALQTAWKVGKDGIEAGTDLVPGSIPRPIARIGVAGVLLSFSLFVLKSFVSTAFFVLGVMGLIYFVYIAINKDEGPRGGGRSGGGDPDMSEDSALEEARRIMEKYK